MCSAQPLPHRPALAMHPQEAAPELCCAVLDTLTALVAGSPPNRRALE